MGLFIFYPIQIHLTYMEKEELISLNAAFVDL